MKRQTYFDDCSYFRGETSGYKLGYHIYDSKRRWTPLIKTVKHLIIPAPE